jgi:hypothetical protein
MLLGMVTDLILEQSSMAKTYHTSLISKSQIQREHRNKVDCTQFNKQAHQREAEK